ncbi:MAG TPA: hypothetical protein VM120_17315 [Bryobacteraceae bacterium]|nr:hypothetical protein [Bryobacteraceae bacterium]
MKTLLLVTLFAGLASAQMAPPLVCTASAVRSGGQAGDVLISCTGGQALPAGSPLPLVNISIALSVSMAGTDAMLVIGDPQASEISPCGPGVCTSLTASAGGTAVDATGTVRNAFPGARKGDTTVIFTGVPFAPPGTSGSRVFRTKNVRAAAGAEAGSVFAFVSIENPPAGLRLENSAVSIAALIRRTLLAQHMPR